MPDGPDTDASCPDDLLGRTVSWQARLLTGAWRFAGLLPARRRTTSRPSAGRSTAWGG